MSRTPPPVEEQQAAAREDAAAPYVPKVVTYNPMKFGVTLDGDEVTLTVIILTEMVNINVPVAVFEQVVEEFTKDNERAKAAASGLILPEKPELVVP